MDIDAFLAALRSSPGYAGQIVHTRTVAARPAVYSDDPTVLSPIQKKALRGLGIEKPYVHQAEALRLARKGRNIVVTTGTASGKSLCYALPCLELLHEISDRTVLMLFPTKALCQDQHRAFRRLLDAAGMDAVMSGVFDGDTPTALRRKLRDHGSVILSNPDMVHSALMPQHGRWSRFLSRLSVVVLDELHTCTGIFGSNMAMLLRRFIRLCAHYGSSPRFIACSATIANPKELAQELTGLPFCIVDNDTAPHGAKTYVFWNPPRLRGTVWRSRRSANVEAHELMTRLIENNVPTITFSKAKMTAEMIHRYVSDALMKSAPQLARRTTPYRGGYLPEERRAIEQRLFSGELIGVSTTPALELGIDIGSLDACIIVGYPGTRAAFLQQAGRAGRMRDGSAVFLIGLDTAVNQYIMSTPDYLYGSGAEFAVIDPANPFVALGHARCATHELPVEEPELTLFGPHAGVVFEVLEENMKLRRLHGRWYHASEEVPQHEVSLRSYADATVLIKDEETKQVIGEINRYDAEPIVHPQAIYMHQGDTWLVTGLDMVKNIATVRRERTDYYTQPLGGTDIHHIDARLREKPLGAGMAYWGEVTAIFRNYAFEKIGFYSLDAISVHGLDLPELTLETMAFWIVPPEELMLKVRGAGLDPVNGLRGIGYAVRMLLPLHITCDTLDFSHTVGSVNSPWNAVFVYERHPHGLGFTARAYDLLDRLVPAVLDAIVRCPCTDGCPCCVGKPLRKFTTWNVERGESSIPNKHAARMILEGLIGDGSNLTAHDTLNVSETADADRERLRQALRRRLERMREPQLFHEILPQPLVKTGYPQIEKRGKLAAADVVRRGERRRDFDRELHRRIAKKIPAALFEASPKAPAAMRIGGGVLTPRSFPGKPTVDTASRRTAETVGPAGPAAPAPPAGEKPVAAGDPAASRALRKVREVRRNQGGKP